MTLLAAIPIPPAAGQIALAVLLATVGAFLLLPKPRVRSVAGGTFALVAAAAVFGIWLYQAFGEPMPDLIASILFWFFAAGAVGFGAVLVTQQNPARGAIAFAFVILSTCGLFLLLAAPFLMAATIIIYAGAIIVTFLFVLMLSHADKQSDENDRSREPLLGSFAGFAFVGLVLFTLHQTRGSIEPTAVAAGKAGRLPATLPAQALTAAERQILVDVAEKLRTLEADEFYANTPGGMTRLQRAEFTSEVQRAIEDVVGTAREESVIRDGSIRSRLAGPRTDSQAHAVLDQAALVYAKSVAAFRKIDTALASPTQADVLGAKEAAQGLRDDVRLLAGAGDLPARNVSNLGLLLYADHLLAVELAGTLLLVATIGAVAIAHRKGGASS